MFIEQLEIKEARKWIAQGKQPYQFLTKDPHAMPIFGPGLEDRGERNRAVKEGRLAESIEVAQQIAKRFGTEISYVSFLTEAIK
jgi:hypothetical protein